MTRFYRCPFCDSYHQTPPDLARHIRACLGQSNEVRVPQGLPREALEASSEIQEALPFHELSKS